jgi:hypothetical protein
MKYIDRLNERLDEIEIAIIAAQDELATLVDEHNEIEFEIMEFEATEMDK